SLCGASGMALASGCQTSVPGPAAQREHPTIILITLDTTRADHLGCYGYRRPTSPNIDRLADDALVYDHAIATGTWTLPSHASLFTGKFPTSHGAQWDPNGAIRLSDAISGEVRFTMERVRTIARDESTLATLLKANGYTTGAVVGGPYLKKVFGLDKGFDFYDDSNISSINGRLAEDLTDQALAWLSKPSSQPRFLFLNYFDPHTPLNPPHEFAQKIIPGSAASALQKSRDPDQGMELEQAIGLYDAEILYMDHHVGRLFDGLQQQQLYDDAWVIVTADHGEELMDHDAWGHGNIPYQGVVHIPMIVKQPGVRRATGRSQQWIQLTDVLPMILDHLHIALPPDVQANRLPHNDHAILIESRTLEALYNTGHWLSIFQNDKKFIWSSKGNHMLFDLGRDRQERKNLIRTHRQEAKSMQTAMLDYRAALPRPGTQADAQPMDAETLKALKGLGYIK
ncbi:MAG TPA: sulfatase, partial [Pirellulales bacterium]|nr:sulfatase [Pirellulales bacterium]